MTRHWLVTASFAGALAAALFVTAEPAHAKNAAVTGVTVQELASGPVKNLPAGRVFLSTLEFRQQTGSVYGPHGHTPSIVYTLRGNASFVFPGNATRSVGAGAAAFFPPVVFSHENLDGRVGGAAIAAGFVVVVAMLCAATLLRGAPRSIAIATLSVLLIAGGAFQFAGVTSDDYYLMTVRPVVQRTAPMPRPDAWVVFSSPDLDPVPAAPYTESLNAITVPPGAHYDTPATPGPLMIVVTEGSATLRVGDVTTQLGGGGAGFAQTGQTLTISNQGSSTLRVLDFAVTPISTA